MSTVEHLYPPILRRQSPDTSLNPADNQDEATAWREGAARSSFFWGMQLLSVRRRRAMYALDAFCREVNDIAVGAASCSLKETLLLNWRSEIANLYAGRPRRAVTRGLTQAVHLCGLRCDDFLAIIDGAEMDARTEFRAPSLAQLDRYCECVGVAVSRLSARIFGEESPAGERVAAELGRALQLTKILHNLAEDARRDRLYLPRELLHAHNMFATTPSWVVAQPELRHVCRDLARLAERHFAAAAEAMVACPHWTMRPAAVMLAVDRARLHELLARGWRPLDEPAQMPAWRKLGLVVRHGLAGR